MESSGAPGRVHCSALAARLIALGNTTAARDALVALMQDNHGRATFGAQREANAARVRETGRRLRERFPAGSSPSSGHAVINAFREEAVAKIVKKANAAVNALVTNANYSSNIVIAAVDFDYNDVVDLDTALDDLLAPEQRGLVLNSSYIGALRKDAKLTSAFNTQGNNSVVRTGIVGQIGTLQVMQFAGLAANGENLVGFAAAKDAICIGTGSVWSISPNSGTATSGGLSVMVESEYTGGILYLTAAIRFGVAKGRANLKRIKSA
jgi:hypothetical protein